MLVHIGPKAMASWSGCTTHIQRAPVARGQEKAQCGEHTADDSSQTTDNVLQENDKEAPLQKEGEAKDTAAEETEPQYPL